MKGHQMILRVEDLGGMKESLCVELREREFEWKGEGI